ncbi:dehydrogenase reductase SDR family member 7 [Pelobates cultripes]|uniref:Dehydrogenase reductase SDR family member 7 n=1 Tax=Pelobates cultripes TaxID=61616 RepID=A0AAD1WY71_PELCU|nr:dehydrogenase reductase SDR family member 7 [Pelobates cultripes]
MELLCVLGALCVLYFVFQLIRFLRADADLTLLWAELLGHSPESKLSGNVVWVTGASSGIGEELSYQLAKLGSRLVLSARRENELLKIDVLVNNGGRSQRSLCMETDLDVYRALLEVNYVGTVSLTKHVLQHMVQRKKGKVISISSVTGFIGVPLSSGYAASKHALQGFLNSLRVELGSYPDITISIVCPGPVQSKIVENAYTEKIEKSAPTTDQSSKMPTERCARLILITIANNLYETWIAEQPFLAICYLWQYTPTWAWWLTGKIGARRIQNFKRGVDADSSYFTKKIN